MRALFGIFAFFLLFIKTTHAGPVITCKVDEYYETVLETCEPCSRICSPLSRSDCQQKCKDYIQSLTACSSDQFLDTILGVCLNCTSICSPTHRTDCIQKCSRFLDAQKKTTPGPITTTKNDDPKTRPSLTTIIIIIMAGMIAIACLVVVLCCVRKTVVRCCRRCVPSKPDKSPIQEEQGPAQSATGNIPQEPVDTPLLDRYSA